MSMFRIALISSLLHVCLGFSFCDLHGIFSLVVYSLYFYLQAFFGGCRVMRNIDAVRLATEFHSNVQRLKIQQRMQRKQSLKKVGCLWKFLMVLQNLIQCHMLLEKSILHNHIEDQWMIHCLQIIVHRLISLIEAV